MISDKRGTKVESKLKDLFAKAEVLGAGVRAEHDRRATVQRERDLEDQRRVERSNRTLERAVRPNGSLGLDSLRAASIRFEGR